MPKGDGLGFVSKDYEDLFRELRGDLANKEPSSLKPPWKVPELPPSRAYPFGVLTVKLRMPGERFAIQEVVQGDYMRWSVVEALAQSFKKLKANVAVKNIFMCAEIKILEVHTPSMAGYLWQFCEFRFDYQVVQEGLELLPKAVFDHMTEFEIIFCQCLENKFRDIYHLTVLGLLHKRFALMDHRLFDELALYRAAEAEDLPELRRLLALVDVDAVQAERSFPRGLVHGERLAALVALRRTPLLAAAEAGHVEAVRLLLEARAEVNYQDTAGFSALYLAAGKGVPEVVSYLLEKGAELHARNRSGYTALHNAVGCGTRCIQVLLEARGDLNLKSRAGVAPVHVAAISNQPESLEVLQRCKANLDMPAVGGNTPVHEAVMQNNVEIIQKLYDLKADVNVESGPEDRFATPLRMALERKKKKAAKKLQELKALEKVPGGNHQEVVAEQVEFRLRKKTLR